MTDSTTHTTPSGFQFTLRPPSLVPERLRRPVAAAMMQLGKAYAKASTGVTPQPDADGSAGTLSDAEVVSQFSGDELAWGDELNDLLALALVTSWSSTAPINRESLLDLPAQDYDAIRKEVAPHAKVMFPDFSPTPETGTPTTP